MGLPTVFVRLTGCPLRCGYCDTAYAFSGGKNMSVSEIMEAVVSYSPHYVTVTGGEPLAQVNSLALLTALCDQGYSVSLETSGALDISRVDTRVSRIVDIKTPGSGEMEKNHWENLTRLTAHDEIKFVLCDKADYDWARQKLLELELDTICPVLFSPAYNQLGPADVAAWILHDRLPVRLQLQLDKLLWGECVGR